MQEERRVDIVAGLGLVSVSCALMWATTLINAGINTTFFDNAFWPRATLILLILLGLVLAARGAFPQLQRLGAPKADGDVEPEREPANLPRLALATGLCVVYAVVVYPLGFLLSTPLYVVSFMYMLGDRHVLRMAATALVLDALLLVLFGQFLTMPLPRGLGPLREFSFLLY